MYLVKSIQNTVTLRLQANASTANPQWLFKLTCDQTGQSKVFAAEDISDFTEAYNLFRITEGSSEDLSNGHVSLSPSGTWTCDVYEMAASSPRNLNVEDAIKKVKTEICIVYDGTEGEVNNFTEEEDRDNPVFDEL